MIYLVKGDGKERALTIYLTLKRGGVMTIIVSGHSKSEIDKKALEVIGLINQEEKIDFRKMKLEWVITERHTIELKNSSKAITIEYFSPKNCGHKYLKYECEECGQQICSRCFNKLVDAAGEPCCEDCFDNTDVSPKFIKLT